MGCTGSIEGVPPGGERHFKKFKEHSRDVRKHPNEVGTDPDNDQR